MCGRYKLTTPTSVIIEDFNIRRGRLNLAPRYNIAPTQEAPVVRGMGDDRTMSMMRWGLVPSWAKDTKIAFSTINARAETVADKPAFRDALRQRRALVIADGFYEWKSEAGGKQPYLFARCDGRPMAFAGLWEHWTPPDGAGEAIDSFTIIVTAANDLMRDVHDRMPVILNPDAFDTWLDPRSPSNAIMPLLRPYDAALMQKTSVSRAVNSVKNEGPEILTAPARQGVLF
jgi:putative SOS response-associated peptidase YedK